MLTDAECRNAVCPEGKLQARFTDGRSLYLQVSPAGSKRWFFKFKLNKQSKLLALGPYPKLSLSGARAERDRAKEEIAAGKDPCATRKLIKLKASIVPGKTFREIADGWFQKQIENWSPEHAKRTGRQLERDLYPWLGDMAMPEIEPHHVLAALQRVEARGALETADRVLMVCKQVWTYWMPVAPKHGRDATQGLKARLTPYRGKSFPAIIEPKRFGQLIRAIRAYRGGFAVRTALQIAPMLYQRPANLRMMEWQELHLDEALWVIPSAKMKRGLEEKLKGEDHTVPLPSQVVELLRNIQPLTGSGKYVFPTPRNDGKPLSDNALRTALYSLDFGKEQSIHGFRASARTLLVDELGLDVLAIEANLAHQVEDANGRSYNRTQYRKQRLKMAQTWADYLDTLANGAEIIQLKTG